LQETPVKSNQQKLTSPKLPLAIYREVVAHLRQIKGVNAGLIPQNSTEFDYLQSQIGGLWIESEINMNTQDRQQLEQILAYYAQKYAPWENYENGLKPNN
jgi:hypothetical protein